MEIGPTKNHPYQLGAQHSPILRYAASNWGRHAVGEIRRSCQQEILAFLGEKMLLQSAAQVQDDDLIYAWP